MPLIILIIIIIGVAVAVITFFMIKTFIVPKKVANLIQMLKQGKSSTVARMAKQILSKEPKSSEAHYILGQAYLMENKPELALMEFKTVNQIGNFGGLVPEKEFREKIGSLFERYGQPEEALKEYLLLIKLEPNNPEYYYSAGTLFEARDKSEKAANYYRKTLQLDPRHSDAHFKLGELLYRNKKPVEAKKELELAINLNPENYRAYYYLGKLLKDNHDYVSALHALEKAQRDPEFKVKALIERGVSYIGTQSYDSAIAELDRAVKASDNPASNEALYAKYFLAACFEKKRNIDRAMDLWEEIYSQKKNFRDVAEKLSQYQDLRTDDRVKDYLTAPMDDFYEICKSLTGALNLTIRDISDTPNGCQVIAVDADTKMRNQRKIPRLIRYLRVAEMIPESTVRSLHEEMKTMNIPRGVLFSSSNFSRKAAEFAETRPIDLYNKDHLQKLLKKIKL